MAPDLLRLYVGYRLLLSVLFFSLVQLQWAPNYLGSDDHQLFSLTIFLYTAINILTPLTFYLWRWKPGETAIFAMLLIDTAAITVMMYASGNLDGSLGYLLLVTVAASGVLQRGILALALAAIASVIVITTCSDRAYIWCRG
jgi:two-component system sensor histidine kinase PilS (NtrC family)